MTPENRRLSRPSVHPESENAEKAPAPPPARPGRARFIFRAALGACLIIGVAVTVAWALRQHVLTSSRFAVKAVDVVGDKHRSKEELVRTAGILAGTNIFALDLDDARQKLLADPWVQGATLTRRLPDAVLIQVIEREAGALVALGEVLVATREGEIFKTLEPGDPTDMPIITGLSADAMNDDREGTKRTIRRAIDLASDYERSGLGKRAALQEIHVGEGGVFSLVVGKTALSLALGEPPYRRKLDQAVRVLAELEKRGSKADAIMLDNEARPDRVIVRVR